MIQNLSKFYHKLGLRNNNCQKHLNYKTVQTEKTKKNNEIFCSQNLLRNAKWCFPSIPLRQLFKTFLCSISVLQKACLQWIS